MTRSSRALSLCLLGTLVACGQTQMVQTSGQMRSYMIQENPQAALATLRKSKQEGFKEQDRVVYWMNEGMLLHLIGNYKDSINSLSKAERRSIELYTKSISKGIKAAFTSNAAKDYEGEDYEKVLLNVFKALDFLGLGDTSGALVEARKINEKLKLFNTKYKHKNVYNQDAFAHWLMGLLFEMEGSYDDARIAYVAAMEVYQNDFAAYYGMKPPPFLAEDIVRASLLSSAPDIANQYRQKFGANLGGSLEELNSNGEVILVHLNGEGPSKSDFVVTCWFISAANWACDAQPGGEFMKRTTIVVPSKGTVVKVAYPELHIHEPMNPYLTMAVSGHRAQSHVVLPISQIAVKTMADKMHRIFRDSIIRIITKLLTSKAAGKAGEAVGGKGAGGKLLGWLAERGTSAAMQAMEEADKRAWTTLPSRIEVARLMVPPGTHNITLTLANGKTTHLNGIKVVAGKRVVVTHYSIP